MIYPARMFVRKQREDQVMILMVIAGNIGNLVDEALHDVTVLDMGDTLTLSIEATEKISDFNNLKADQILCHVAFSKVLE